MAESTSDYISPLKHKQPAGKKPLIRNMAQEEVLTTDGKRKRLLVLSEDQEKYKDFVMSFRNRKEEKLMIDPAAMGIFHYLSITISDYRNVCEITTAQCADMVNKSVPVVKKWFAELIDAGYIKRIKPGLYMLSPYHTIQVRKRYFPILEAAWEKEDISTIRSDMVKLDEKAKAETARNKKLVAKAELSACKKRITIPEAAEYSQDPDEEFSYMESVKVLEKEEKAVEKLIKSYSSKSKIGD